MQTLLGEKVIDSSTGVKSSFIDCMRIKTSRLLNPFLKENPYREIITINCDQELINSTILLTITILHHVTTVSFALEQSENMFGAEFEAIRMSNILLSVRNVSVHFYTYSSCKIVILCDQRDVNFSTQGKETIISSVKFSSSASP